MMLKTDTEYLSKNNQTYKKYNNYLRDFGSVINVKNQKLFKIHIKIKQYFLNQQDYEILDKMLEEFI